MKKSVITGKDSDLHQIPMPYWNRRDSGRYILTYGAIVTKGPTTNVMNVGIYRRMVTSGDRIPVLMWRAQHLGQHATVWQNAGKNEMRIAVEIGLEPSFSFSGGALVVKSTCEYDVMGAIHGEPVDLVKCETVDLYVPATAEIAIERYLQLDPADYIKAVPFAALCGLSRRPLFSQTDDLRHCHHSSPRPSSARQHRRLASEQLFREHHLLLDHARRHCPERARLRRCARHVDVQCAPVYVGLAIGIKQSYRGQPRQAANAICGPSGAHVHYEHSPVDNDIDIHDYTAVGWAIVFRINAGENKIMVMPRTFGVELDPSTQRRDPNPALLGRRTWNRVLIDLTMNLDYDPDLELGGAPFPPSFGPSSTMSTKPIGVFTTLGCASRLARSAETNHDAAMPCARSPRMFAPATIGLSAT